MVFRYLTSFLAGTIISFSALADTTAAPTASSAVTPNAINPTNPTAQNSTNNNQNSNISAQIKANYCPKVSDLIQDKKLIWQTTDSGWKSFAPSFVKTIGNFINAQWTGINYGKIICIYQGERSFEFPVALEQTISKLYMRPQGHGWNLNVKGYIICQSNNIYDCPFYLREEEVKIPTSSEIYKQLQYQGTITPVTPSN